MVAGAIILPVIVTFGWSFVKKINRFNKRHNIISLGDDKNYIVENYWTDENELEIDKEKQFKPNYTDECYC